MSSPSANVLCVIDLYTEQKRVIDILFDTVNEPVTFSNQLVERRVTELLKFYNLSPFNIDFTVRKIEFTTGINELSDDVLAYGGDICLTAKDFKKLRLIKNENKKS